jgi:hypothetical protein
VKSIITHLEASREAGRQATASAPPTQKVRERITAYPGPTRNVYDRPIPVEELSGRRHVPKIVGANGIPFLRFKKPQSHYLSRIIRNKVAQRMKWFDAIAVIEDDLEMAKLEDVWENAVEQLARKEMGVSGLKDEPGSSNRKREVTFEGILLDEKNKLNTSISRSQAAVQQTAEKLLDIVDAETELYQQERQQRKHAKMMEKLEKKFPPKRKSATGSVRYKRLGKS